MFLRLAYPVIRITGVADGSPKRGLRKMVISPAPLISGMYQSISMKSNCMVINPRIASASLIGLDDVGNAELFQARL